MRNCPCLLVVASSLLLLAACGGGDGEPAAGPDTTHVDAAFDGGGDIAAPPDAAPADIPPTPDVVDVPAPPDVVEDTGDGPCVPRTCAELGVACGPADDGCGGELSCGACGDGRDCVEGACVCATHVETRCHDGDVWWFDGCDEPEALFASCDRGCEARQCLQCVPDCGESECGPDPVCGVLCGSCLSGETCAEGRCVIEDRCPGVPLSTDGSLDLDIPAVRVSGAVTVDGAALPDEDDERGALVFVAAETGALLRVPLDRTGPFVYAITLPPDDYAVRFDGNEALCADGTIPGVPCVDGTIHYGVSLRADGVLDVDIPTVRVEGAVTLAGAPLPDEDGERGRLRFDYAAGGFVDTEPFGATGSAAYGLRLLPGRYRVDWRGERDRCRDGREAAVPCNEGPLMPSTLINQDGVLDVDVGAIRVQGAITQDGAALPDDTGERGALRFLLADGGTIDTDPLGRTGSATYRLTLLPGDYTVAWAGDPARCSEEGASAVACNTGTVLPAVRLTQDGVLDVNVPTVRVQGAVLVNGAAMEDETGERGRLRFVLRGESEVDLRPLGASGAARYDVRLLAGRYDVRWDGEQALCDSATPAVPCNDGPVVADVPLTSDGVLDVDLPAVRVQGAVLLNGGELPALLAPLAGGDRGRLRFALRDSAGAGSLLDSRPLGVSGSAAYGVTLLAGRYDIRWEPTAASCDGDAYQAVPCNPGVVVDNVGLTTDGVLDVDVPAVRVQGAVTLEGAPLPDEDADRGALVWARKDDGDWEAPPFGAAGAEAYRVTLLSGRYVLRHRANPALCDGVTAPDVPCADGVLAGCD